MLRLICALTMWALWLPAQAGPLQELTHVGRAVPIYGGAPTPELERLMAGVKAARLAERMAQMTQSTTLLRQNLAVVITACGPLQLAYFDPGRSAIVMCLELLELIRRMTREDTQFESVLTPQQRMEFAEGAVMGIYLHELAHALVTINNISITGREEDVADQFAVYFASSYLEPRGSLVVLPTLWFFAKLAKQRDLAASDAATLRQMLANEHSLDEQRIYNMACWSLGSGSLSGSHAAQAAGLPQERAGRCQAEYMRLQQGIRARFQKYFRVR